jgi:DivIVA domain-containing protein
VTGDEVRATTFRFQYNGYSPAQVDAWRNRVADLIDSGAFDAAGYPRENFTRVMRGYNDGAVDRLMIALTGGTTTAELRPKWPATVGSKLLVVGSVVCGAVPVAAAVAVLSNHLPHPLGWLAALIGVLPWGVALVGRKKFDKMSFGVMGARIISIAGVVGFLAALWLVVLLDPNGDWSSGG